MKKNVIRVKIVFVFTFLICCLICCKQHVKQKFDEKLIEEISNENTRFPSKYTDTPFFIRCNESQFSIIKIKDLRYIYNLNYKNISYSEFLRQILNQELISVNINNSECFILDENISEQYKNANNFESFLNLYTVKTNSGQLILKNTINQTKTILYYFFINNYLSSYDDYGGNTYIYPTYKYLN